MHFICSFTIPHELFISIQTEDRSAFTQYDSMKYIVLDGEPCTDRYAFAGKVVGQWYLNAWPKFLKYHFDHGVVVTLTFHCLTSMPIISLSLSPCKKCMHLSFKCGEIFTSDFIGDDSLFGMGQHSTLGAGPA